MTPSIELSINQHLKDSGIQIDVGGAGATGIATAIISHKEDDIVTWGFTLTLGFTAELKDNEDGSPNAVISYLEVSRAHTWYGHVEGGDYVHYRLSAAERELIIPQLQAAVLAHIANSGEKTVLSNPPQPKEGDMKAANNSINEGGYHEISKPEHMSLNFNSQGFFINAGGDAFRGHAGGLLDENIEFTVDFDGYYESKYQQAEYEGGVLISPKSAYIRNFSIEDFSCADFTDMQTGEYLHDYELSEEDEKIVKYIILHQVKMIHAQSEFPLGQYDQPCINAKSVTANVR